MRLTNGARGASPRGAAKPLLNRRRESARGEESSSGDFSEECVRACDRTATSALEVNHSSSVTLEHLTRVQ